MFRNALPKLFGNERHERMHQTEPAFENGGERELRLFHVLLIARLFGSARRENRLRDFQVPITKVVPKKAIELERSFIDAEAADPLACDTRRFVEPTQDPSIEKKLGLELLRYFWERTDILKRKSRRVPNLVQKMFVAFEPFERERDALVGRRKCRQREAERVGTERG